MKKLIITSACIIALSTGGAFAQMQPAPGASSEGNVGPGATKPMTSTKHKKGTTTGMGSGATHSSKSKSMSANPSSSGNVGPGTNNNAGPQPGGR